MGRLRLARRDEKRMGSVSPAAARWKGAERVGRSIRRESELDGAFGGGLRVDGYADGQRRAVEGQNAGFGSMRTPMAGVTTRGS
jgi:hypothetical protein